MSYSWKYNIGEKFELYVTSVTVSGVHVIQGSVFRAANCAPATPFQAAMVYRGRIILSDDTYDDPEDGKLWVEWMIESKIERIKNPSSWEQPDEIHGVFQKVNNDGEESYIIDIY